jgi:glutathione synthase/RimK-type ligase-like ATP-grasp enzyme
MIDLKNILLLTPYSAHSVANGVINSGSLENNNVFELNFNESPESNKPNPQLKKLFYSNIPQTRLATSIPEKLKQLYIKEISDIVESENIDLIIPTKEKYVLFLSQLESQFKGKLFLPSEQLVHLFQNKLQTRDFLHLHDITFPVVETQLVTPNNLEYLFSKPQFVKPAIGSGGKNSKLINNIEEFHKTFGGLEETLISCEPLIHPEYNHTIIIKNGEIVQSGTYQDLDNNLGASSRQKIVEIDEINDITNRYVQILNKIHPGETNGAYNIDFLKNNKGNLVLTEVNVGRLPGGHAIFNTVGKNMTQSYIEAGTQK